MLKKIRNDFIHTNFLYMGIHEINLCKYSNKDGIAFQL